MNYPSLCMAGSLPKGLIHSKFILSCCIFCLLALYATGWCADPVRNLRAEQRGNQIFIYYDLEGDAPKYEIVARGSSDGGENFDLSMKSLKGDLGEDIHPGRNKTIVWDALRDVKRLIGDEFVFEVTASEIQKPTDVARIEDKPPLELTPKEQIGKLIVNTHGDESQVYVIDRSRHWLAPIATSSVWTYLGLTPNENFNLPAGRYWVRVVFDNKQDTKPISIKAGETSTLNVTFEMITPGGAGGGGGR
ncbi:MAG: hypothetical protein HY788_17680 [Deltaproteobacteria bacterium]|nr:hypothetical protein [Deltaproteobacteria bacterium]